MSKLILASASPRRLELLNSTKVFQDIVEPSNIDESLRKKEKPRFYLKRICYEKALNIQKKYKEDIKSKYIPPFRELEEFRIKRYYNNGNEKFDEHVDVTDSSSSLRAVAFLFYLNDNDGNTLFPLHNLNIQPVSGRVIVFPPTWEYPHTGLPPKIDSKYIMSTYIHYGENWNYYSS